MPDPLLWMVERLGLVPRRVPDGQEADARLTELERVSTEHDQRIAAVERRLSAQGALHGGPWDNTEANAGGTP